MDISIVNKNCIKIRGKRVTFIVDPIKEMAKTSADCIISLNGLSNLDSSRVTDSRVLVNGSGEYEIGGAKISGTSTASGAIYKLSMDDINMILGKSTSASKLEGGFTNCQIVLLNMDGELIESFVTSLEPKITVLYGEKKLEGAKTLGVESTVSVAKLTTTKDKLPEKMEVVVLN